MASANKPSWLSPKLTFTLVAFSLGELGDGLNIFQGIYLIGLGWPEGSIGLALSLMGLTSLLIQPIAGDLIDKTPYDRRTFLSVASLATAFSALTVMFVRDGNRDHAVIYVTKICEGVASSFIAPCLAALTLANFGPVHFDAIMARNILWGHVGSVVAAMVAGVAGYVLYPNIKYCFLVIGFSALMAVIFVGFLPEGDPLMGRGFHGKNEEYLDDEGHVRSHHDNNNNDVDDDSDLDIQREKDGSVVVSVSVAKLKHIDSDTVQEASSYAEVFFDRKTFILCLTGFFFHFANANVLLVLGELMGSSSSSDDDDDSSVKRTAIPLIAGAITLAQLTMSLTTLLGDKLTERGWGRKTLFMAGLVTLPVRCALIIFWSDWGDAYLLSTQVLDGIGGGFFGLLHPYLVADITFGTGRFNVVMGLTAACFGTGATLSNFLGQLVVEKIGHIESLMASFVLSLIPCLLFGCLMPETYGMRGGSGDDARIQQETAEYPKEEEGRSCSYVQMTDAAAAAVSPSSNSK